jgi:hypothetical protein
MQSYSSAHGKSQFCEKDVYDPRWQLPSTLRLEEASQEDTGGILPRFTLS